MYHWSKARHLFEELTATAKPEIARQAQLRLLHLYTQCGQLDKARDLESRLQGDCSVIEPQLWFDKALLRYEEGRLEGAVLAARQVLEGQDGKLVCEAWGLLGDLYSSKGDLAKATEAYRHALDHLEAYPANWRPVRQALLLNNLADVYEQFEEFEKAHELYEKGWQILENLEDDKIYDLEGYRLELLLSYANLLALEEDYQQALAWLAKGRHFLPFIPMPRHLYWKSRFDYLEGLCRLYADDWRQPPFELLYSAWKEQEQFLTLSKSASLEYLGKIAYYAAYCYDPAVAHGISQEALYEQALGIFEQCAFKDPKFFNFSIASIKNDLGTLALKDDPELAVDYFWQAFADFEKLASQNNADSPIRISLMAVILNLLFLLDDFSLQAQGAGLLDELEHQMAMLQKEEDSQAAWQDAYDRLLQNERLSQWFGPRLEHFHERFGAQAA